MHNYNHHLSVYQSDISVYPFLIETKDQVIKSIMKIRRGSRSTVNQSSTAVDVFLYILDILQNIFPYSLVLLYMDISKH